MDCVLDYEMRLGMQNHIMAVDACERRYCVGQSGIDRRTRVRAKTEHCAMLHYTDS